MPTSGSGSASGTVPAGGGGAGYPTAADLAALLAGYGVTLDAAQVNSAVLAGIRAFEHAAGRHMLAGKTITNETQAPQTRTYLPPENHLGILDLAGDLPAPPTVTYQPQGSSSETLALLTDYRLDPENAPYEGRPYERLQFRRRWYQPSGWGFGASVQVTGTWGYGLTIPEDAWRAMLAAGLLWLAGPAWGGTGLPLKAWKEGDVSEDYAAPTWSERRQQLQADLNSVVARYRKVTL